MAEREQRQWSSVVQGVVAGLCGIVSLTMLGAGSAHATDLDDSCTVSIQNRTVRVRADGTWIISNAPANVGQVRARATCVTDGVTESGQSEFFQVPADGSITLPPIGLGTRAPAPSSISVVPAQLDLDTLGESAQLVTTAVYPNFSRGDVTAAPAGTTYVSSNPAIASVSADGLVSAVGSGTVLISVSNEGALTVVRVRAALGGEDSDGDGIPDDVELANGLNPNDPTDALEDPDLDGLNNKQELIDFGTDPNDPDSDGDGIEDGEETIPGDDGFVTNPLLVDTDGDGIRDGLEIATGSDPTDPLSFNLAAALASVDVTPAVFVLTFNTLEGEASRQLAVTGDLIDGTTIDLTPTARGTNYTSDDLAVCNFGGNDGEVFAGIAGSCTVTVDAGGFEIDVLGIVRTFAPVTSGFVAIPGFANNVETVGDLAFVAAGAAGLQVVDVTDHALPVVVASIDTPGNANDVVVEGATAYVADGAAGLRMVDVTDPLNPALLGALATVGDAWSVAIDGNTAFVAAGAGGLEIVDVTDPLLPVSIDSVATSGTAKGVAIDAGRGLAVIAAAAGLDVVDVSTPSAASLIATAAIGGNARDVVVDGNFAYVADFAASFTTVDLTAPFAPVVAASTPQATGGLLQDVATLDGFGFGADVFFVNGVPIVDVTVPAAPIPRSILDFSAFRDDNGTGIDVDESFVYLTAATTITENGGSGNSRLYVGQYRALVDRAGAAPTVAITAPLDGGTVVAGGSFAIAATASDDVEVSAVAFLIDGEIVAVDIAAPFQTNVAVPVGATSLTLGAFAIDPGDNVGVAADVVVGVDTAPTTTVTGTVLNGAGATAGGATVICNGVATTSAADGSFSVEISILVSQVQCTATVTSGAGVPRVGSSGAVVPVAGGQTEVGSVTTDRAGLTLIEPGWAIARVIDLPNAQAAHFNPVDGLIYAGQDATSGGLFRIDPDGTAVKLHGGKNSSGLVIDPDDGDIFVSESS